MEAVKEVEGVALQVKGFLALMDSVVVEVAELAVPHPVEVVDMVDHQVEVDQVVAQDQAEVVLHKM